MLDKTTIGEELRNRKLKCQGCGFILDADNELEKDDFKSIEETGYCLDCFRNYL